MRWPAFATATILSACTAAAAVQVASPGLTGSSVGPLHFGMSIAEIEGLGLPVQREIVRLEDEPYDRLIVEFRAGQMVEVLSWNGQIGDISTRSAALATSRGARVGDTLAELRALYPEGRMNIGVEETRYFNFETPEHGIFDLDRNGVPESCFQYRGACPDLGAQHALSYRIRDPSR